MDGKEERFLIVRLGAIGDIIHCLPCADYLKKSYPNCSIHWIVDEKNAVMLKENPLVDKIYSVPLSRWKRSWLSPFTILEICKFNKKLIENRYTWAFDLHGMFKSLVIFAFCGAQKKVGYKDYKELATLGANILVEPKAPRPYTNYPIIQRYLDLIRFSGLQNLVEYNEPRAILPKSSDAAIEMMEKCLKELDIGKKTVIFAPKTTWDNKHWDVCEWQKLYNMMKNVVNIVFSGVEEDLPLINEITNGDKNSLILAGKTNLTEYIELISHADLVISPDSSAAHIAWAIKCEREKPEIITIFAATSKYTYCPPTAVAFPKEEQNCLPCHKKKCALGHQKCTEQALAQDVYSEAIKLLTKD